jgi:membrane protein implicated in regulation of membrane protease activity
VPCFSQLEQIFIVTAGLGALLVVARLTGLFLGLDDAEGGIDGEGDDVRILSLHGLSSFLLMFGLVGLVLASQARLGPGLSLAGAVVAGVASFGLLAKVTRLALRLQSSGTLQPGAAAGCPGTICARIPPGGAGRVQVRVGGRLREMDARERSGLGLATGTPVRVLRVERTLAIVQAVPLEES